MHFYIDRMVHNEFGERKKEMCYADIRVKYVKIYSQKDVYCPDKRFLYDVIPIFQMDMS